MDCSLYTCLQRAQAPLRLMPLHQTQPTAPPNPLDSRGHTHPQTGRQQAAEWLTPKPGGQQGVQSLTPRQVDSRQRSGSPPDPLDSRGHSHSPPVRWTAGGAVTHPQTGGQQGAQSHNPRPSGLQQMQPLTLVGTMDSPTPSAQIHKTCCNHSHLNGHPLVKVDFWTTGQQY